MKHTLSFIFCLLSFVFCLLSFVFVQTSFAQSGDFVYFDGKTPIAYSLYAGSDFRSVPPVILSAIEMWKKDMQAVTGFTPQQKGVKAAKINFQLLDKRTVKGKVYNRRDFTADSLAKTREAFFIKIDGSQIYVCGSDPRGLAYGILELSRLAGVSPWEDWADASTRRVASLRLPRDFLTFQSPSVEFRGIFLNDEDWGLTPFSTSNYEPDAVTRFPLKGKGRFIGQIGPKTYERIFQLLLRLRANTLWPAMHEATMPFYFVEGNRQMAERYGILVSTSHCEPMMRNSATEWDLLDNGAYNYFENRQKVLSYWEERLKELENSENIFTIGMRGKHDGRMEGARTTEQYRDALNDVIKDQTDLLRKYINRDVTKIPQQFIPYKEVLDVYNAGLQVPDYVTLVWPDDNHGYIRHFPTAQERARSGGNGVYYHTSYWGVPHDNLWLGIVQPSLMYQQMQLAYGRGVRKIWILNVGDIKPSEYLMELFLDMAWNVNLDMRNPQSPISNLKSEISNPQHHLSEWLVREFGKKAGEKLLPVMQEFYLLSHIRKPEFMGGSRIDDRARNKIRDLPFTEDGILDRIARFEKLSFKVEEISKLIPEDRTEAYFQLIKYPVQASSQMNGKLLNAQLARHSATPDYLWKKSDAAYDSIVSLTKIYNSLNNGKWNYMMDFKPRRLLAYERVPRDTATAPLAVCSSLYKWNGAEFSKITGNYTVTEGLGYEGKAVYLAKGCVAEYGTRLSGLTDSITVEICLVPTHAVEGKTLRFSVQFGNAEPQIFDYETAEFSEEWKENILRAQAIRTAVYSVSQRNGISESSVIIKAIDEGIVIDRVFIKK